MSGPSVARNLVSDFDDWISVGEAEATTELLVQSDSAWKNFRPLVPSGGCGGGAAGSDRLHRPVQPSLAEYIPSNKSRTARFAPVPAARDE